MGNTTHTLSGEKAGNGTKIPTFETTNIAGRVWLSRLDKDYALGVEEFNMGVKSKAQLDVQQEEYTYKPRIPPCNEGPDTIVQLPRLA